VNKKNVSVCHARSNRQTHVHLSTSNVLQLVLSNDESVNFLLKVQGILYFLEQINDDDDDDSLTYPVFIRQTQR